MIKISVILPNYNGGKYIKNAINSFLSQEYDKKELIIIDGKSTDDSHQIIDLFSKSNDNIRWIKKEDSGISNAFNIGLKFATGDYVGYLGSDDIIYMDLFKNINYNFQIFKFDAIYFNSYTYYVSEKKIFLRICPDLLFNFKNLLSYGTIVGWQNIYFSRNIYNLYSIDETNKTCMDYEFYLRVCLNQDLLVVRHNSIGTINYFDNNISSDLDGRQHLEAVSVARLYANKIKYSGHVFGDLSKVKNKIFYSRIRSFGMKILKKLK